MLVNEIVDKRYVEWFIDTLILLLDVKKILSTEGSKGGIKLLGICNILKDKSEMIMNPWIGLRSDTPFEKKQYRSESRWEYDTLYTEVLYFKDNFKDQLAKTWLPTLKLAVTLVNLYDSEFTTKLRI